MYLIFNNYVAKCLAKNIMVISKKLNKYEVANLCSWHYQFLKNIFQSSTLAEVNT
jgi:hypothetical protein